MDDIQFEQLRQRLKDGEYLELSDAGGTFEVWAEPLANPPSVYYEGDCFPITELDEICRKILSAAQNGSVRLRWVKME